MEISTRNILAKGIRLSVMRDAKEVGRAFLYVLHNDLHKEPFGLMEDVFVEETTRGKGIGTELVQAVIAEAKKQNCYKLIATSRTERQTVHELYERLGFKKWGVEFRMEL